MKIPWQSWRETLGYFTGRGGKTSSEAGLQKTIWNGVVLRHPPKKGASIGRAHFPVHKN